MIRSWIDSLAGRNLDVPGAFFFSHGRTAVLYEPCSELELHHRKYQLWKARPVL